MKIRTGFVSNSSSSSFVAYGVKLDQKKLIEMRKRHEERARESWHRDPTHGEGCCCPKCTPPKVEPLYFSDLTYKTGLEFHDEEYNSDSYVGVHPKKMQDDETLRQFKIRIAKMVSDVFYEVKPEDVEFINKVIEG